MGQFADFKSHKTTPPPTNKTIPPELPVVLLKAEPRKLITGEVTPLYYQKTDYKVNLLFPYLHRARLESPDSFTKLFKLFQKLLTTPEIGQVFGIPEPNVLKSLHSITRKKKHFLSIDPDTNKPHLYNYVVLEIDHAPSDNANPTPSDNATATATATATNTPFLLPEYSERYLLKELDPDILEAQARHTLTKIFPQKAIPKDIPIILRLSSSFYKTEKPAFRVHLIIPTTAFIPTAIAPILGSIAPMVDISIYRTTNHILYTAAPNFINEQDPLTLNVPELSRIYHFDPSNLSDDWKDTPVLDINRTLNSLLSKFSPRTASPLDNTLAAAPAIGKLTPAWELSGDRGIFNLQAHYKNSAYSIPKWLEQNNYTQVTPTRWKSPTSTSDAAGLVIIRGDYVFDHHENSPIHDLIPHSRRLITAYDLHYHKAVYESTLSSFNSLIYKFRSQDPKHKQREYLYLKSLLSFIIPELIRDDIDSLVFSIVEQVFESRIDSRSKDNIFKEIVAKTKLSAFPFKSKDIQKIWKSLISDLSQETGNIDPSNSDMMNAMSFINSIVFDWNPKTMMYTLKHPKEPILITPDSEESLDTYIGSHIINIATSVDWSLSKIKSTTEMIKHYAKSNPADSPLGATDKHLYLFKNSFEAINIFNKEIMPLPESKLVQRVLPFTKEEYLHQVSNPPPHWQEFLSTSLPDKRDQEIIRLLFAYLFSPVQNEQKVICFHGLGRSGKSTIKNIMAKFFASLEFSTSKISDSFILSKFSPVTQLFVINEFNVNTSNRSNFEMVVNLIKEISGRDTIQARSLRKEFRSFKSDALPLLISNQLPTIRDKAFQNRLLPLYFGRAFPGSSSSVFQKGINESLPHIFHWAISMITEENDPMSKSFKPITFKAFESLPNMIENKKKILQEIDFLALFCQEYIRVATPREMNSTHTRHRMIAKPVLRLFIEKFYEKTFDDRLPEIHGSFYPNIKDIQKHFSDVKITKSRMKIGGTIKTSFSGVRWIDYNKMVKELSPYNEYLSVDLEALDTEIIKEVDPNLELLN